MRFPEKSAVHNRPLWCATKFPALGMLSVPLKCSRLYELFPGDSSGCTRSDVGTATHSWVAWEPTVSYTKGLTVNWEATGMQKVARAEDRAMIMRASWCYTLSHEARACNKNSKQVQGSVWSPNNGVLTSLTYPSMATMNSTRAKCRGSLEIM